MTNLKKHINAILGTILFHLIVIACAMFFSIKTTNSHQENYTYIDIDFIEDMLKDPSEIDNPETENNENFNIEDYLSQLRNVGGSNINSYNNARNNEINAMSQDELRQKYEAELLKEKYGDNYEAITNRSYEDYMSNENSNANNNSANTQENRSSSNVIHAGPALVFVELDNKNRGNSHIHVPVFTCKDGGTIVIGISISNDGKVKSTNVISAKSKGDVDCLINAARNAALRSRFTTVAGTGTESGKITYQFIEQ